MKKKIDRLIFNLGNSIAGKGTDLTQALAMTPMLRVDDNGISIVGKSGVSVMINEKMLHLNGAGLMNYLKSLRSDDVERIEVITTPPAKYEAQGNSGIINIVLKKNPNLGWSGNISSAYQQATYPGFSNSGNLNFQSGKVRSTIKIRQYSEKTRPTEQIDIVGLNSILSSSTRKDTKRGVGTNLSLDYKVSNRANIGFIYDIGEANYDMDIDNVTTYLTNNLQDSVLTTHSTHKRPTFSHMLNLYYDQKLSDSEAKLSSVFNFFSTRPETNLEFLTQSDRTKTDDHVVNNSNLDYKVWSAQTDLTMPTQIGLFEAGLKYTDFDNNSNVEYYNLDKGNYKIDSSKSNAFNYDEMNIAGYISFEKELSKKWSTKAGLRYEYSLIDGFSVSTNEKNRTKYGRFFPSAYLAYKANPNSTINLSYSKRINRPNFSALNPFRWYSNPYTYSTGNPFLQPSYNHNLELSYLYKGMFFVTFYGQKLVNGYDRIVEVDHAERKVSYQNYLTGYNSGVETSISFNPFPWWENREFFSFNFARGSSAIPEVLLKNGSAIYYSSYNTFKIKRSLSLFLNFWHSLPSTQGNVYGRNRSSLTSGLRFKLLDNKFLVNLSVADLFKGATSQGTVYYQDFDQFYNNYYDARRLNISVTYIFGKDQVKGNRKRVDFNEMKRAD